MFDLDSWDGKKTCTNFGYYYEHLGKTGVRALAWWKCLSCLFVVFEEFGEYVKVHYCKKVPLFRELYYKLRVLGMGKWNFHTEVWHLLSPSPPWGPPCQNWWVKSFLSTALLLVKTASNDWASTYLCNAKAISYHPPLSSGRRDPLSFPEKSYSHCTLSLSYSHKKSDHHL